MVYCEQSKGGLDKPHVFRISTGRKKAGKRAATADAEPPVEETKQEVSEAQPVESAKRARLSDIGDIGGRKPWKVAGSCKDGSAIAVDDVQTVRKPNGLVYRD